MTEPPPTPRAAGLGVLVTRIAGAGPGPTFVTGVQAGSLEPRTQFELFTTMVLLTGVVPAGQPVVASLMTSVWVTVAPAAMSWAGQAKRPAAPPTIGLQPSQLWNVPCASTSAALSSNTTPFAVPVPAFFTVRV